MGAKFSFIKNHHFKFILKKEKEKRRKFSANDTNVFSQTLHHQQFHAHFYTEFKDPNHKKNNKNQHINQKQYSESI